MRANAFAAAFLMPAAGITKALTDEDVDRGRVGPEDIVHLMYRFGVSFQAILWRLLNLRWITSRASGVAEWVLAHLLGGLAWLRTRARPSRTSA